MHTEVVIPDIMGDLVAKATVTRWLKNIGDRVERNEPLFEISTDIVDAEIPSPVAGLLTEILVKEGATVEINTKVAVVTSDAAVPVEGGVPRYHPHGRVAGIRPDEARKQAGAPRMKTILLIAAQPRNRDPLDLAREAKEIDAALRQGRDGFRYAIHQVTAATWKEVGDAFLTHRPAIVHFMGHGAADRGLVLEDAAGYDHVVSNQAIAALFELFKDSIECVVFNAYATLAQAEAVKAIVPAVIATPARVEDEAARAFSRAFYRALADGQSYEFAYRFGLPQYLALGPARSQPVLITNPDVSPPRARQPLKLFYAYADKDKRFRADIETILAVMKRQGLIEEWHDGKIPPGTPVAQSVADAIDAAHVILLLVSADFLASDLCWSQQVERAMKRHLEKTARVIPILLKPCEWDRTPFGGLQPLPDDRRPINAWSRRSDAFANVAAGIRRVVESM